MESNQTNDNHSHTMRNILVPIIVVVALIIVSIFFSGSSAFKSVSGQSAAVGSSVQTKVPTTPNSPARIVSFLSGTVGAPCIIATFDDNTGNLIDLVIGTEGSDYSCDGYVLNPNAEPLSGIVKIFGSKITAKHYSVLQAYLSSKGYLEKGYNTAKRDTKTRTALKAYQQSIGITATGSLSAATKAKLNMEISRQMKPAMKVVDNSQTTDQGQIEKIIDEAIRTKKPVDPNSPLLSTGAVCEQAYSLCVGGCYLSGSANDSTSDCLLTCAQAWLSCHKGFNSK